MGGSSQSKLEKALDDEIPDSDEKYFGFDNFGATCYCNSVLQSLFFCDEFRRHVLDYDKKMKKAKIEYSNEDERFSLLASIADLFGTIQGQKKRTGSIAPRQFVSKLRWENEIYQSSEHQDAHEFLNYILNNFAEVLQEENKQNGKQNEDNSTWVHDVFGGILTNETTCLSCENTTSREEQFLDLSIDVEQNSSVTACLKKFSSTETLRCEEKFFCDACNSLQEADKRMRIKKVPQVLALHLKRFKYSEELGRMKKLNSRVVFPFELRLPNTSDDSEDDGAFYSLKSVVIHIGSGLYQGHYICLVKSNGKWLLFDDEEVDLWEEWKVPAFYGSTHDHIQTTESGYLLFYQRENEEDL